ncbi:hypothetical protein [Luteitalea pratensis]|uniref:hypothetical protein n=1 Tax=Luteitalea pratensis TaxID=1855912 RepID=UPI0012FF72EC|nr:hypothetical protein [Luteitalea pratensis]
MPGTSTSRVATRTSRAARACLFVALSALAVPACQHFEGEGSASRETAQALERRPAPAAVTADARPPRVELKLDAYS